MFFLIGFIIGMVLFGVVLLTLNPYNGWSFHTWRRRQQWRRRARKKW